jgi:DNA-binding NarL/FixJ family response regulator
MNELIIHVAIAEDQKLFRACLVPILNSYDHINVVSEVSNGAELMHAVRNADVVPDVVILDLAMPEMNGLETTEALKKEFPDVKIIVLTVHNEERHIVKMVGMGVNGYLVKNAEIDEVIKAIESVMFKGFYFNESTLLSIQNGMSQRRPKSFDTHSPLTIREKEILELICKEFTTPEIAEKLYLSVRTVDGHRNHLLEKTGARNTAGLVLYALRYDIVQFDL